jgi:hypothetical protein
MKTLVKMTAALVAAYFILISLGLFPAVSFATLLRFWATLV